METMQQLINNIAELEEDGALAGAEELLRAEVGGREVLRAALEGLKVVGRRYEAGEYYVAGLVMAGEIMRQILEMVADISPIFGDNGGQTGTVVLGTIEGDIHDLGKDLVKEVLVSHGFAVHDLGVDVAPEVFLAETIQLQPDLVGISILISTSYPALTRAVTHLKTMVPAGFKRPGIIVGGGAMDQAVFEHIKADIWCQDVMSAAALCLNWLEKKV